MLVKTESGLEWNESNLSELVDNYITSGMEELFLENPANSMNKSKRKKKNVSLNFLSGNIHRC